MSGHENDGNDRPSDTRPYLCMPYWLTPFAPGAKWDDGQIRPLTKVPVVIPYMCDAIHPGSYTPGEQFDVRVDVLNSGGGNSAVIAIVSVYWAEPTAGFGTPEFLGSAPVVSPPSPTAPNTASVTIPVTIPLGSPAHVCLLVSVQHPLDKAGAVPDPVGNRHWAQRNLMAVAAVTVGPTLVQFAVGNPFGERAVFNLVVRRTEMRQARVVADTLGVQASDVPVALRLRDARGGLLSRQGRRQVRIQVELEARGSLQFQMEAEIGARLPAGQGIAIEAVLLDPARDGQPVGSLGAVLLGE
ncbi:hypothetical protein ACFQX4_20500 [Roseomonas sp. GCM10028921]